MTVESISYSHVREGGIYMRRSASNNKYHSQLVEQAVSQKDKKLTILFDVAPPRSSVNIYIYSCMAVNAQCFPHSFPSSHSFYVIVLVVDVIVVLAVNFVVFLSFNFATIFYANDITTTKSHEFVFVCVCVCFFSLLLCCLFLLLVTLPH